MGQIGQRCGVSLEDDWRGYAWEPVGEADVPCVGIQGDLECFREGDLEMLFDADLVWERGGWRLRSRLVGCPSPGASSCQCWYVALGALWSSPG